MPFALTLGGRLIQFALALAGVRIATTLLVPVEMGRVSLILALTAMFVLFFVNPVTVFINRRLHAWADSGRLEGHLGWFWLYLAGVTALAALVLWLLTTLKVVELGMAPVWVIVLVCGSVLIGQVNLTVIPALNMLGRGVPFMTLTIGTVAAGLAGSILFARYWKPTAEGWLLGVLAGQAIFAALGYRILFGGTRSASDPISRDKINRLARFAWPIAVSVALYWVYLHGYRFHLADVSGLAAFGLFAAGYGLAASLLSAMEVVLTTHFQPAFYRDAHQSTDGGAWSDYAAAVIPTSLLGVATVIAAAPDLAALLLGPAYQSAGRFVALGALAEGARMMVGLFGLMAHLRMRTSALILPYAAGTIVSSALIWFFLPRFGMEAAPVAVMIGGIVIVGGIVAAFRNVARFRLDFGALARAALMSAILVGGGFALHKILPVGKVGHVIGLAVVGLCAAPGAWWLLKPRLQSAHPPAPTPEPARAGLTAPFDE